MASAYVNSADGIKPKPRTPRDAARDLRFASNGGASEKERINDRHGEQVRGRDKILKNPVQLKFRGRKVSKSLSGQY
jgi:hypothetical protein